MLEVYNLALERVAILENAFDVTEHACANAVGSLIFSLPGDDPKTYYLNDLWFVRLDGGDFFRIQPQSLEETECDVLTCTCEHAIATLIDDVLIGYHIPACANTAAYIRYVLDHQTVRRWQLGQCAFDRRFEYAWTDETLLAALWSIATPLTDYLWTFDFSTTPWTVSLTALDTVSTPNLHYRTGKNLLRYGRTRDPQQLCTRLYPRGYGEGVNQLTIKEVNGGCEYIESPPEIIAKYGLISRVWTDRRYENAESLFAAARTMLAELQKPVVQHEIDIAKLEGDEAPAIGKRVRIVHGGGTDDTYIVEMETAHGECDEITVTLANRASDIASTVADLADRQRIEQTYAQGATQLYSQALQGNASKDEGLQMDFYLPGELRIINKIVAKVRLSAFRSYSKATSTTDTATATSSSGGGSTYTSSSGGGTSCTTSDGGGTTKTTTYAGDTVETTHTASNVEYTYNTTTTVEGHAHEIRMVHSHEHEVELPSHKHKVTLDDHSHDVDIPSHTHRVKLDDHTHTVSIPGHGHEITPGIFYFGSPKSFTLYVNGQARQTFAATEAEIDLTAYLIGEGGIIARGAWHTIEIRPDDLAYICVDMYVQGFVQSRGDYTV